MILRLLRKSNHTATLSYRSLLIIALYFKLFSLSQSSIHLTADASISSAVITLTADDPDSGSGGKVNYSILSITGSISSEHSSAFRCINESNGTFRIDEYTGTLRVARTLASLCVYKVTIRAMDHGSPPLYSVISIEIETGNATDLGIPTTIAIVSQEGLFTLCLIHSFIHSCIHASMHPSVRPSVRPSIHPSVHSIHSFIHSFTYSYIYSSSQSHSLYAFPMSFVHLFIYLFLLRVISMQQKYLMTEEILRHSSLV